LDLRILKALIREAYPQGSRSIPSDSKDLRKSFRSMAKELGVDQATMRRRMRKFQEQRILKGWYLGVDPGLREQNVAYAWFKVGDESAKESLIERLLLVSDVERVLNYLGREIRVVLTYRKGSDPTTTLKRLGKLAGPNAILHKQDIVQIPVRQVDKTDWEIIGSLRQDPWKPYSVIAQELRVSNRTVKRRVTRMSEDGTIHMQPIIDLGAIPGILPGELAVEYASPESRAAANERITSYLKEALIFAHPSGTYGRFALMVSSVSQVEQITKWVKRQDGVRGAEARVVQDVVLNRNHYMDWRLPIEQETRKEKPLAPLDNTPYT
jgi:DNA-binding Lrp family transcriptional regulator